ncbi:MSMEG_0570 family nitrogen starvation response protein [Acidisoma cladoniae]|jgi:uncharacterized repeat protein (TIGR04042 family)|uniref:MSMEG_0570 family nitrogen starvation response protein n=1 Tax=Acidisoma cladoniae TaxID=3040935 RepID=UPI00254B7835|nr:MSMEG_0570 family nitrogen starvation response protein [Acidisoma sp. PAMC 29798]
MPEMEFGLRWPDGAESACYSPSLVVEDHLTPGETYPLADLLERTRAAMTTASARVEAKYGFPCSRALGTLAAMEQRALAFDPASRVTVTGFRRLDGGSH